MRFLLLISLVIGSLNAQTLKFSNGITTSKLNWQVNTFQFKPYKSYISNYSFFVGVDWMQHKNLRIGSSIGYLQKGGQDVATETDMLGNPTGKATFRAELDYLSLNTTADLDFAISKQIVFFGGVGPRFDFLVNNNKYFDGLKENHDLKRINYGLLFETGFKYCFAKYEIGLKGDYYLNFNKIADWPMTQTNLGGKVSDQTFGLNLVLGYRL